MQIPNLPETGCARALKTIYWRPQNRWGKSQQVGYLNLLLCPARLPAAARGPAHFGVAS